MDDIFQKKSIKKIRKRFKDRFLGNIDIFKGQNDEEILVKAFKNFEEFREKIFFKGRVG